MSQTQRVGAHLVLHVRQPLRVMFSVAVPDMSSVRIQEELRLSCDGAPLDVTEASIPGDGRVHLADPSPDTLT